MSEPDEYYTGDEYAEEDRGCDYDLCDECMNSDLRDMGNCFECSVYLDACEEEFGKEREK